MSPVRGCLLVLSIGLTLAGCGNANNGKVHQLIVPPGLVDGDEKPTTKPAPPPVDKMDAAAPSPELLAKKTAALVKQIDAPPPAATKLPAQPSAVQIMDSPISLSLKPPGPERNVLELTPLTPTESRPTVDPLTQKLAQRVADNPKDLSGQLDNQLLNFLQDKPTPDASAIAPLPSDDRELLATLLDGLTNFRANLRTDANMMMSAKISPLLVMAERLRVESDLTTPTLEVCDAVKHFGDYHPMSASFPAGKENPAIIYCEVANFMSNLNAQQQWETHLKLDVAVYSLAGPMVWSMPSILYDEQTRTRRRDYYIAKLIKLPSNLLPGQYVLKVGVTDQQSSHISEHSKDITIVAK